jgi:hypothetical protein
MQPPLTMTEFFQKSAGVWLTQRTVHHFDTTSADESGDSNLYISLVAKDDPRTIEICKQQGIDPTNATGGGCFMWQANQDTSAPNPDHAAVLIDVPDDETGRSGKLLRDQGYVERIPVVSRYWFGQDGILTIDTEYENNQGQERCWFLTDDFRIRASTVRMMNGVYLMTYCSERRCVSDHDLDQMLVSHQARAAL